MSKITVALSSVPNDVHTSISWSVALLDHYAIPVMQTGKQLSVRGEVNVAHFYGSNSNQLAQLHALLRFF